MSFVAGFYSFNIEISNAGRNLFEKVRFKTARHPSETARHLLARAVAFAHSYEPGNAFSRGLFDLHEPTIWRRDVVGTVRNWIFVGSPDRDLLQRALRHMREAEFRVYFYEPDQLTRVCSMLRGSKTNWAEDVLFYQIDPSFLNTIEPLLRSSMYWTVTIVDNAFYLVFDQQNFETVIEPVNIWSAFQVSIGNQDRS